MRWSWPGAEQPVPAPAPELAVLAVQVQQIATDLAKHEAKHEREQQAQTARDETARRERKSDRRWLIGLVVAVIAAIDSPLFALFFHLH